MRYKIHVAYINYYGVVVPAGVYDEKEFDVAEARCKSVVTLEDITIPTKEPPAVDFVTIKKIESTDNTIDVVEKELQTDVTTVKLVPLKINSATADEIAALKYIGKATANKVISERVIKKFTNYNDLDKRVPLRGGKHWQDIYDIDFENNLIPFSNENSIAYI